MTPRFWLLVLLAACTFPGFAQTVAQQVAAATPVTDPGAKSAWDSVAHQATLVAVTVWILQQLKRGKWFPWLNANTETATRIVSWGAAFGAALLVEIHVTGGDAATGFHGTWSVPSLHVMFDAISRFVLQKTGQESLYTLVYKKPVEVTPVVPEQMDRGGKPRGEEPAPIIQGG